MAFNSYMHERNIYRNQPDFTKIALDFPAFRKYAIPDAKGKRVRVDFTNPEALRMVTEILLKKDFNLDVEIPKGFLIPTVPQRLNYILWLEDLLAKVPGEKKVINGIDIGTGPCAIFSILGARKNNWNFIATENCDDAIHWAKKNITKNNLEPKIKVIKVTPGTTLSEILSSNEDSYDFCLCNPPFFGDIEEIRKKNPNSDSTIADLAREKEIFCQGGEFNFVKNILNDSLIYKDRVCLFTSMCGKKKSFLQILKEIKEIKEAKVTTTEFCQGNTVRWGIAWTFKKSIEFDEVKRKLKPQKAKPPLEYQIPIKKSKEFNLQTLVDQTESFLKLLQIPHKVTKSSQYFTEFLMKSDENTWTHQRRKRREMQRQKKETKDLETQSQVSIKKEIFDSSTTDAETLNSCDSSGKSHDLQIKSDSFKNNSIHISPQSLNINNDNPVSIENKSIELEDNNTLVINMSSKETDQSSFCVENKVSSNCKDAIFENESDQDMFPNKKRKCQSEVILPVSEKNRLDMKSMDPECSDVSEQTSESEVKTCPNKEILNTFTQAESKTDISQMKQDISEINISKNLFSDNAEKLAPESNTLTNESKSKENDGSLMRSHEHSVIKMEIELNSIDKNKSKIGITDEVDCKHLTAVKDSIRNETDTDSHKKIKDIQTQEGSVLYCHLQLIKGKGKVYVKMNCPANADRNTMYQVFQLIKNKIK